MEKLSVILISIAGFLLPHLSLPQFLTPSLLPKLVIMVFLVISLALVVSIKIIKSNRIEVYSSPLALIFAIYLLINVVSVFQSSGKYDAVISVTPLACSFFLYILIPQLIKSQRNIITIIYVCALSISLSGIIPLISKNGNYPEPIKAYFNSINESNSIYSTALLLIIIAPIIIALITILIKKFINCRLVRIIPFTIIITVVYALASINVNYTFYPQPPVFLNRTIGWTIALETIKKHPLLGIGPGNFANAYTLYKPLYAPNASYPSLNFNPPSNSSNEYFQIITTSGILGISALLIFIFGLSYHLFRKIYKSRSNIILIGIFISFQIYILILALFPTTALVGFIVYIFLSLSQSLINEKPLLVIEFPSKEKDDEESFSLNLLPFFIILILSTFIAYSSARVILGEINQRKSINAANAGNFKNAVEFSQKSIEQNPISDTYHNNNAVINYYFATLILKESENKPDTEISESDKSLANQYLQRAIDEGKIAVNLNPQKVRNIQTLAAIYDGLAQNLVPGADQFSIEAYQKSLAVDPTNPTIMFNLGKIYFGRNEFSTASAIFKNAVLLQSNYADARYGLGHALIRLNQLDEGLKYLQSAADIMPEGSKDKEKILKEIDDIKTQISSFSAQQSTPKPTTQPKTKPTPSK